MRIIDMQVTPIAVGDPPRRNAAGLRAAFSLRTIVELVTDDGLHGWSEIPGSDAATSALREAAEVVVDRDPYSLHVLERP